MKKLWAIRKQIFINKKGTWSSSDFIVNYVFSSWKSAVNFIDEITADCAEKNVRTDSEDELYYVNVTPERNAESTMYITISYEVYPLNYIDEP